MFQPAVTKSVRKMSVQEKRITLLSRFGAARNAGEVENIVTWETLIIPLMLQTCNSS